MSVLFFMSEKKDQASFLFLIYQFQFKTYTIQLIL